MTSLTLSLLVALTTALYASHPTPDGNCNPDSPRTEPPVVSTPADDPVTAGAATLGSSLGKCKEGLTAEDVATMIGELIRAVLPQCQCDAPARVIASEPFTLDALFESWQRDELVMSRNGSSIVASPRSGLIGAWRNPETDERYQFTETGHIWRMGGANQLQSQLCGVWQTTNGGAMVTMFDGEYRQVTPSVSNIVSADPSQEPFFPLVYGDQVILERVESAVLAHTSED